MNTFFPPQHEVLPGVSDHGPNDGRRGHSRSEFSSLISLTNASHAETFRFESSNLQSSLRLLKPWLSHLLLTQRNPGGNATFLPFIPAVNFCPNIISRLAITVFPLQSLSSVIDYRPAIESLWSFPPAISIRALWDKSMGRGLNGRHYANFALNLSLGRYFTPTARELPHTAGVDVHALEYRGKRAGMMKYGAAPTTTATGVGGENLPGMGPAEPRWSRPTAKASIRPGERCLNKGGGHGRGRILSTSSRQI